MLLLALATAGWCADLSVAIVGDPQTDGSHSSINWEVFPALLEGAEAAGAEVLLVAGDLVAGGATPAATAAQWADFNAAIAAFDGEVYMVPGNHDMYGGVGSFAAWRTTFPWLPTEDSPPGEEGISYYIDRANARFVFITSDHEEEYGRVSSAGLAWLDTVLAETTAEHVFVLTHHPVTFSQDNSLGGVDGDLWQLLIAYGVDGLFTGHWHRYQPSQPGGGGDTWETILGTGGGWQGFEPIRPYQQVHGLLLLELEGAEASASFLVDEDGDGAYDDLADSYTIASADELPRGLRARYTFDEGSAEDSAPAPLGKAIHGSLQEGATIAKDALELEGSGDHVEAGAIGDYVLAIGGDLTLSLHARVDSPPADDEYGAVLAAYATADYYTEDEQSNYSWYLSVRADGSLVAFWEHDEGENVYLASTAPSSLLDGAWHHISMVRDARERSLRFEVDGKPLGLPLPYTEAPTGGGRGMLYLGADVPAYPGYDLHGALDEICVFDLVLEAEHREALRKRANCAQLLKEVAPPDTGEPRDSAAPPEDSGVLPEDTGGQPDRGDSAPPEEPSTPAAPSADGGQASGCGCGVGGAAHGGWLLLGLLALNTRRRRSPPPTAPWGPATEEPRP